MSKLSVLLVELEKLLPQDGTSLIAVVNDENEKTVEKIIEDGIAEETTAETPSNMADKASVGDKVNEEIDAKLAECLTDFEPENSDEALKCSLIKLFERAQLNVGKNNKSIHEIRGYETIFTKIVTQPKIAEYLKERAIIDTSGGSYYSVLCEVIQADLVNKKYPFALNLFWEHIYKPLLPTHYENINYHYQLGTLIANISVKKQLNDFYNKGTVRNNREIDINLNFNYHVQTLVNVIQITASIVDYKKTKNEVLPGGHLDKRKTTSQEPMPKVAKVGFFPLLFAHLHISKPKKQPLSQTTTVKVQEPEYIVFEFYHVESFLLAIALKAYQIIRDNPTIAAPEEAKEYKQAFVEILESLGNAFPSDRSLNLQKIIQAKIDEIKLGSINEKKFKLAREYQAISYHMYYETEPSTPLTPMSTANKMVEVLEELIEILKSKSLSYKAGSAATLSS